MLLLAVIVTWVAFGAIAVLVLRHRGHDPFGWAIVFLILGPLAVPLAVSADRHPPPEPPISARAGHLDVLVAHDGSAEASTALDAALVLLGDQLTSLTLADVVDAEASTTVGGQDIMRAAEERLDGLARRVAATTSAPVDTVVLYGVPARALDQFAAHHGYDLIVACRGGGHGASRLVRRGLAQRLAARASVPVLTVPAAR